MRSRTVYHSPKHCTLVLEEDGQKVVYSLVQPDSVIQLFKRYGFPEGHVGSGLRLGEEPTGPLVLLHRTYLQRMPGRQQPEKLIWCCEIAPDRDTAPPVVLTPQEAKKHFDIEA